MDKKNSINESLSKLEDIVQWFEDQKEVDVEAGLVRVKEGVGLIKELRTRLRAVENEFKAIKEELDGNDEAN